MPKITRDTLIEQLVEMGMAKSFTFVFEGEQQYWITYDGVFWCGLNDPFGEIKHSYWDCLMDATRGQMFREAKKIYTK
jgi:hypothetical protein